MNKSGISKDKSAALKDLRRIPGVGAALAEALYSIGIHSVAELKSKEPERLYMEYCRKRVRPWTGAYSMFFVLPSTLPLKKCMTKGCSSGGSGKYRRVDVEFLSGKYRKTFLYQHKKSLFRQ